MKNTPRTIIFIVAGLTLLALVFFCGLIAGGVGGSDSDTSDPIEVTRIVEKLVPAEEGQEIVEVQVTRLVETQVEVQVPVEVEVTRIVEVEVERLVTATPPPPTATPEESPEEIMAEIQAGLTTALISDIEGLSDVERVNSILWSPGRIDIELYTLWASRDNQADVTWIIIALLAEAMADATPGQLINMTGSQDLVWAITTFSTHGDYRYISETDQGTLVQLANRAITYDQWATAANAGFR